LASVSIVVRRRRIANAANRPSPVTGRYDFNRTLALYVVTALALAGVLRLVVLYVRRH
jgi:hypothetical protein